MKLPNLEAAVVPQEKVTDYLLSPTHRDGRHKAAFFLSFGFSASAWQELVAALLKHAQDYEVVTIEDSPFGTRYVVEGTISALDGRSPNLRSVWVIEKDEDIPRFVTAYPLERR
jgi:hypothetical protein